jgi:hypothetical protein
MQGGTKTTDDEEGADGTYIGENGLQRVDMKVVGTKICTEMKDEGYVQHVKSL